MKRDISTYENGREYLTVSTYDFKKDFSKLLREMNRGEYDGAVVTSYGRMVGIFLPESRLGKKE
jgi:hypothetical protein